MTILAKTNKRDVNAEETSEPELVKDESAADGENEGAERRTHRQTRSDSSKNASEKKQQKGQAEDSEKPGRDGNDAQASGNDEAAGAQGGPTDNDAPSGEDAAAAANKDELAAERDKYLRLAAEYDNYRKRSSKERDMIYSEARADAITRMLPIYDNIERALKMDCADEAFYKGVEMIMTQLTDIFENLGVAPITAVGEQFDPNRHNAVSAVENPELGEKIVAEEYQKGFTLGDRVIRFSTVVVAN